MVSLVVVVVVIVVVVVVVLVTMEDGDFGAEPGRGKPRGREVLDGSNRHNRSSRECELVVGSVH